MNLNYDNSKVLILEMETENHEKKDKIIINKNGLVDSLRIKDKENDNSVYFGYKELDDNVIKLLYNILIQNAQIDYYLPDIITKSNEFKEKSSNNFLTRSSEKNKNIFFKIYYNCDKDSYYLKDMGVGYGTFYKIKEETLIKENNIINIGESYLIFSFKKGSLEDNENINEDDLVLKIYSNEGQSEPMLIQKNSNKIYKMGRSEKCDVVIKDKVLSRVHCILYYSDNNWYIKDGNENGNESTNGTWFYASEEIEIKEGMIFKSNSCNFICNYE